QMGDALVLEQRQEGRAAGNAVLHVSSSTEDAAVGWRHLAYCSDEINGWPSWQPCAGKVEPLRYKAANNAREEHMTHDCLAGFAGLLLSVSFAAPSLAAARDPFYWMSEINKASAVMVVERGIVPKPLGARIYDAINKVNEAGDAPGAVRSRDYLVVE